ncbi:MAG: hypothetical protein IKR37_00640 [Paludibacteraceae bacterium]|nr:hypothetical protein [Paludibacteraceae bacterium]
MKRDILTFLLFLVLAALIWYGHAMQSVRNTRVPVMMQYTGKPGNIGLGEPGLPDTVMIEVRDAGARLNTYHREPLHLTVDLRQYIHGEKGTIHVPTDALRRSISDILQGTSRLIDTKPEEISCPYFTEQEKNVVIAFSGEITPANEYQLVGHPELSRTSIKIFGQDKALAKIDTIYTEYSTLTDITDTMSTRLALALPQSVRTETDSINIRVIAERFTEKKFIVPLHVLNVPEGVHLRLFPNEVEVSVRVGISHFAQVQATDIKAVCIYTSERSDKLDVELRYSNPYITSAWVYPGVIEFMVEQ